MEGPNLLVPAIIAFSLLIIGVVLTVYEFYTQRNIGRAPVDHSIEVVHGKNDRQTT